MPRRPVGRPPTGKPRQIRWEDDEWEAIRKAAEGLGMTRSDYVRRLVAMDLDRRK